MNKLAKAYYEAAEVLLGARGGRVANEEIDETIYKLYSAGAAASKAAGERITIRREDGGVTMPGNFDHEAAVQKLACYEDICPDPDALRGRAWAPESRCQTAAMRAAAEDIRGRLLAVSKAMRRWEAELYVGGIAVGVALEEAADLLGGVPPEEYRDEK